MGIDATGRKKDIKNQIHAYYGIRNQVLNTQLDSGDRRNQLIEIGNEIVKLHAELEKVEHQIEIEPIENYLVSLGIEEDGILPIEHMRCRVCHQENGDAIYLDATVFMDHELKDLGKNIRVKVIYDSTGRILLDGILSKEREDPFIKDDKEFSYFKVASSNVFVDGADVVINTAGPGFEPDFVHYKMDEEAGKYKEAHRFLPDKGKKQRINSYKQLFIPINVFLGEYNGRLYNTRKAAYMGNLEFDRIIDCNFHPDDIPYMGQPRHFVSDKIRPVLGYKHVLMGIDTYRLKGPDDNDNLNIFVYLDGEGNIVGDKLFYIHEYRTKGYSGPRGLLKCIGVTNETYDTTVEELKKQADKERKTRKDSFSQVDIFTAVESEQLENRFTIEHSYDVEPQVKTGIKKKYTIPTDEI